MIDTQYLCQWCSTTVLISVDPSAGRRQQLIEDCEICCRPNVLDITLDTDGENATVDSRREND